MLINKLLVMKKIEKLTLVGAIALLFGVLSGCGQKGPLYIPSDQDKTQEEQLDEVYNNY